MLTEKEIKVLKLLQKGLKQKDIAKMLKVSEPTISAFKKRAFHKIRESAEVLRIAKELGLK